MHVGICLPSGDMVHLPFALSLAHLCRFTPPEITLSILSVRQSVVSEARNNLVRNALNAKCDWLLWLDSDMVFPADTLVRLLDHAKPVIGGEYRRRVPPYTNTGTVKVNGRALGNGLTEMDVMPFGCMLTHATAFTHAVAPPWFKIDHHEDGSPIGEDAYFCRQLAKDGRGSIWRDDALSLELRHIGTVEFQLKELAMPAPALAEVVA